MADPSTHPRRRFFISPSVLASAFVWLGIALLLRVRVHLGAGLPSEQPLRWFLAAVATDLAVAGAIVLLTWLISPIAGRVTGAIGAAVFLVALFLQFAWSEFAIYFGHPPAPQSLQLGFHPRILLGAAQGKILLSLVGSIALLLVLAFGARLLMTRSGIASRTGAVAVAVVTCAAALLAWALPAPHRADLAENAVVGAARMIRAGAADQMSGAIPIVRPRRGPLPVRRLVPRDGRAMISDAYPLAYTPARDERLVPPFSEKLNVVIILLEGIRSDETASFGAGPDDLMPNLDRLAREGIRLGRMFSTGIYTPEGEIACWYGTLASPYELLVRTRPDVELHGLPEILRANGWKDLLWIHPGDATLYLSTRFYQRRGFRVTDGRDFPPADPNTNWGYSDRALFRRSVEILDGAREPFASMILTVSNHHPFQVPSDAQRVYAMTQPAGASAGLGQFAGHHTAQMYKTVHYTDEALGHFFELARSRPWFERTLFLILGDHGSPIPPPAGVRSEHHLLTLRHEVPAILYSPRLRGGVATPGPSSQADLVPTLLGLLGAGGVRSGTGIDLLTADAERIERPVISWIAVGNVLTIRRGTRVYHAKGILRDDLSGWDLADEMLVDEATDPDGTINLIDDDRAKAFRADARAFLEDYSALVAEGRSGIPEEAVGSRK
jgi:arylsulfatase A-like enzyme